MLINSFPFKNPNLLKVWVQKISTKDKFWPKTDTTICSVHFLPSDIITNWGRKFVKEGAIPKLRVPNEDVQMTDASSEVVKISTNYGTATTKRLIGDILTI